MNKDKSLIVRLVLFSCGAFVLLLGLMFIRFPFAEVWASRFAWVSAFLIYTAACIPFLLPLFSTSAISSAITGGSVYYKGLTVYISALAALTYAAISRMFPHRFLIIGQIAALFVFAVFVYISLTSSAHTSAVEARERQKRARLNEIRSTASDALAAAESSSQIDVALIEKIRKVTEEVRYISPSGDQKAIDLEYQIFDLIEESSDLVNRYDDSMKQQLNKDLDQILLLCRQRKNVY